MAFAAPEDAARAVRGMHGRAFGGKTILASLFDEVRFGTLDLMPA
jgi:hypothetical protein